MCSWLDAKSICLLDSAYCNETERPDFLLLLSSDRVILPTLPGEDDALMWATERLVKCKTLQVDEYVTLDILDDYLRGEIHIENLHISGLGRTGSMCTILMVAAHCRNLLCIFFSSCVISKWFKNIFKYCVSLKEIILYGCTDLRADSFEGVSCPSLETLALCACDCDDQSLMAAANISNSIVNLDISGNDVTEQAVCDVVTGLPQLRKLGLGDLRISGETVAKIAASCKLLNALRLPYCYPCTDGDILSLVTQCKQLEHLDILDTTFTKVAMLAIAQHCPHLKRLFIRKCVDATAEDDISLLESCTHLESLGMHFSSSAVVAHIPASVTTLTILADNATDEILLAVSLRCQNLSKLIILSPAPDNRLYSLEGLAVTAKGCTRLREVVVLEGSAHVQELADTYPGLKLPEAIDRWEYEVFKPTGYHA